MEKIIKIIIWLFEKYALDHWIDIQAEKEKEEFKKRYDLKDDEIEEVMIDITQRPYEEAFDAGVDTGVEKVLSNPGKYF